MASVTDLNTVAIIGNLVRDADLSYFSNGNAIVKFSIAVNRSRKDGDQWISEANYFDVAYFGKPAEAVKPYMTKGKKIAVQGSLKQDRWEKDGQKFSKVSIVANSVELLGGRSDNASSSEANNGGFQSRPTYSANNNSNNSNAGWSSNSGDDFGADNSSFPEDIPF